jgi:hypothetical protein
VSAPDFNKVWQAMSGVAAGVAGVSVVLGANEGDAANPRVVPIADELLDLPAIVLVPGDWTNVAGGASRISIDWLGAIYVSRDAPGAGSNLLFDVFARMLEAFAAHAKPTGGEATLQYALITKGPGLQAEKWPQTETGADYLTWPFEIETRFNPNTLTYTAAE